MVEPKKRTLSAAKKVVQQKFAAAQRLLNEAGAIMDEHQFTAQFQGLDYMVRHQYDPDQAADGCNPFGFYMEIDGDEEYQKYYAGKWLPSSSWRGC